LKSERNFDENDYFEMFLMLEGSFAFDLANAESGNHIFVSKRGDFTPIQISVSDSEKVETSKNKEFKVTRIYNERSISLDFRSALITRETLSFRELRTFVLSGLNLPQEIANY
jgi:hypothetical protein